MKRITVLACLLLFSAVTVVAAQSRADEIVRDGYGDVSIKRFPVAVQCWTFRKFTFMETLDRVHDLGIRYLQPYRGQKLSEATGDAVFGPEMTDEQVALVREKLRDTDISLVSYGVVNFENTEAAAREVFEFAKKMGIRTIVTEPQYDDYDIIEMMVKEFDIRVAIHNHPIPSKYARPETVIARVKGRNPRMGACADTGHWMRSGVVPVEALIALDGRITDVHLKDLDTFGSKDAHDVPFGQGKANVRDILAELTIQGYDGYLSIEHENPADADNPTPAIRAGVDYLNSIME